MGQFDDLVIFTTTMYNDQSFSQVRAQLALRTFENAQNLGIRTVVVDGGSSQAFLDKLREFSVIDLIVDPALGMGESRRTGLGKALSYPDVEFYLWVEPEKFGLITENNLTTMRAQILFHFARIVVPKRKDLDTLPKTQVIAERCANYRATELTLGRQPKPNEILDLWFGPKMMDQLGASYFLTYNGKPDKWDSIIVPVVQAVRANIQVASIEVDFEYDESQRNEEEDDLLHQIRRFEQYRLIINAIEAAIAV